MRADWFERLALGTLQRVPFIHSFIHLLNFSNGSCELQDKDGEHEVSLTHSLLLEVYNADRWTTLPAMNFPLAWKRAECDPKRS